MTVEDKTEDAIVDPEQKYFTITFEIKTKDASVNIEPQD